MPISYVFRATLFVSLVGALIASQGLASHAAPAPPAKIAYTVSMNEPHTHYFDVTMTVENVKQPYVDFAMPVWTPGSYLVREYAKNVEAFTAADGNGKALVSEKVNKSTWRVYSKSANTVTVQYKVYAFEISVRTSFLDASHGYIQPAAVFMYVDKRLNESATLTVKPYQGWNKISTGLSPVGKDEFVLNVPNFDILVDSPIEVGTHKILQFTALGKPHYVAMYGEGNYDEARLLKDMQRVVEEAAKVVNDGLPYEKYVFIVHNLPGGGGGLEHLNSTTLQTSRWGYGTEAGYTGFLGLVAHEYFHLWNVKRIRPKALGPFDYANENYTHSLWVAEGITSYYEDLLLRRANLISPDQYIMTITGKIGNIENSPGNRVQSVAESSFDAWIKFYRPNENSNNTTVSYYTKGAVLGMLLDLEIQQSTQGQKSLDDVMRYLYTEYYKKQQRGFTDEEMQSAVEKVAGKEMDNFFRDHVFGTKPANYDTFLQPFGLKLAKYKAGGNKPYLGAATSASGGKLTVSSVMRGTAAYTGGLNVNDEIVALGEYRVSSPEELTRFVEMKAVGDTTTMLITRAGKMETLKLKLGENPNISYRIESVASPDQTQVARLQDWLNM